MIDDIFKRRVQKKTVTASVHFNKFLKFELNCLHEVYSYVEADSKKGH